MGIVLFAGPDQSSWHIEVDTEFFNAEFEPSEANSPQTNALLVADADPQETSVSTLGDVYLSATQPVDAEVVNPWTDYNSNFQYLFTVADSVYDIQTKIVGYKKYTDGEPLGDFPSFEDEWNGARPEPMCEGVADPHTKSTQRATDTLACGESYYSTPTPDGKSVLVDIYNDSAMVLNPDGSRFARWSIAPGSFAKVISISADEESLYLLKWDTFNHNGGNKFWLEERYLTNGALVHYEINDAVSTDVVFPQDNYFVNANIRLLWAFAISVDVPLVTSVVVESDVDLQLDLDKLNNYSTWVDADVTTDGESDGVDASATMDDLHAISTEAIAVYALETHAVHAVAHLCYKWSPEPLYFPGGAGGGHVPIPKDNPNNDAVFDPWWAPVQYSWYYDHSWGYKENDPYLQWIHFLTICGDVDRSGGWNPGDWVTPGYEYPDNCPNCVNADVLVNDYHAVEVDATIHNVKDRFVHADVECPGTPGWLADPNNVGVGADTELVGIAVQAYATCQAKSYWQYISGISFYPSSYRYYWPGDPEYDVGVDNYSGKLFFPEWEIDYLDFEWFSTVYDANAFENLFHTYRRMGLDNLVTYYDPEYLTGDVFGGHVTPTETSWDTFGGNDWDNLWYENYRLPQARLISSPKIQATESELYVVCTTKRGHMNWRDETKTVDDLERRYPRSVLYRYDKEAHKPLREDMKPTVVAMSCAHGIAGSDDRGLVLVDNFWDIWCTDPANFPDLVSPMYGGGSNKGVDADVFDVFKEGDMVVYDKWFNVVYDEPKAIPIDPHSYQAQSGFPPDGNHTPGKPPNLRTSVIDKVIQKVRQGASVVAHKGSIILQYCIERGAQQVWNDTFTQYTRDEVPLRMRFSIYDYLFNKYVRVSGKHGAILGFSIQEFPNYILSDVSLLYEYDYNYVPVDTEIHGTYAYSIPVDAEINSVHDSEVNVDADITTTVAVNATASVAHIGYREAQYIITNTSPVCSRNRVEVSDWYDEYLERIAEGSPDYDPKWWSAEKWDWALRPIDPAVSANNWYGLRFNPTYKARPEGSLTRGSEEMLHSSPHNVYHHPNDGCYPFYTTFWYRSKVQVGIEEVDGWWCKEEKAMHSKQGTCYQWPASDGDGINDIVDFHLPVQYCVDSDSGVYFGMYRPIDAGHQKTVIPNTVKTYLNPYDEAIQEMFPGLLDKYPYAEDEKWVSVTLSTSGVDQEAPYVAPIGAKLYKYEAIDTLPVDVFELID